MSEKSNRIESEELRNAINGSIGGLIIGLVYGAATLAVIGLPNIPGVLGALLVLGYAGLGGAMFGAIVGSTGLFARPRTQPSSVNQCEVKVQPAA